MAEIQADPVAYGYFLAIRQEIGEGHDQLVDDMFSSKDGRYLYVSRPSLADVVAIDLQTKQIVWRTQVEGYRADHMAISPDGTRLARVGLDGAQGPHPRRHRRPHHRQLRLRRPAAREQLLQATAS